MKIKLNGVLFLAIAASSMGLSASVQGSQSMAVLTNAPTDVFTPKGFDSDDNVEVVLSGVFSNFCFHTAPAQTRVDQALSRVYVDNQVYSFNQCQDAMMYIPYTNVMNLGVMSAGNYEVWASDGNGSYQKRADLPVTQAKNSPFSPDDVLYVPVSEIQFISALTGDPSLVIKGVLTNSCLSVGTVNVDVVAGNVVQVLPVANQAQNSGCQMGVFPYTQSVRLAGFPVQGDVLIHVRSMAGVALNRVITSLDRIGATQSSQ